MLRKLCPNSGDCVSLGKFVPLLKQYFHDFNIKYAYEIKRIGKPSNNGFVNAITYKKNGYDAYCILKSTAYPNSDNLFYEWWIGEKFINKLVDKFPCFVETYNINIHDNNENYNKLKTKKHIEKQEINDTKHLIRTLTPNKIKKLNQYLIKKSCIVPTSIGVLIQHLNPTQITSFENFVKYNKATEIGFNLLIFQILLQIYIPLGSLSKFFIHNDLHWNNVLIYKLPNNKWITLTYVFGDKQITMKTQFIAKMIDYGRSYYKDYDNENNSSSEFIKMIYTHPSCHDKNRDHIGYGYFEMPDRNNYFVSQITPNITKDLWLLRILGEQEGKYRGGDDDDVSLNLRTLFHSVYLNSTDHMAVKSMKTCTDKIPFCNVNIAMNHLCKTWLTNYDYINTLQDRYISRLGLTPIGELTIYPYELSKDSKLVLLLIHLQLFHLLMFRL